MYIIYEGETDPHNILYEGDWSNGMIGVSKTFGGSSILSSPVFFKNEYRLEPLILLMKGDLNGASLSC